MQKKKFLYLNSINLRERFLNFKKISIEKQKPNATDDGEILTKQFIYCQNTKKKILNE